MIRKQFLYLVCVFEVCCSVVLQRLASLYLTVNETMHQFSLDGYGTMCLQRKEGKQAEEMEQVKADTPDVENSLNNCALSK